LANLIVLDASALIALASSKDPHHDWALKMFRDTASFGLQMSALTQAEVLVHPARAGKLDKFLKMLGSLGLEITPVEESDSRELASIRAKTDLKMPDSVVLQQAIKTESSIATTDQRLVRAATALGVGVFHPNQ
jgi:predicted nucleic acid-binding protein